ncbi:hypothetical protein EIP86_004635 [Pleurotus ostreatoroseus]|nr:hypothetical protein EIP86_004635 [Pleurotus ostreatoroseus]
MPSSLPEIALSRFIINLRQAAAPSSIPSDNRHPSRFSIPNFRMPTLDEVMDNLGEPMDFVEYRIEDDDEEGQEDRHNDTRISIDAEQGSIAGPSGTTHAETENAGSLGSGAGSSNTDIGTNVSDYGIQEAVCYLNPLLFVHSHLVHILQLRLSPTLSA